MKNQNPHALRTSSTAEARLALSLWTTLESSLRVTCTAFSFVIGRSPWACQLFIVALRSIHLVHNYPVELACRVGRIGVWGSRVVGCPGAGKIISLEQRALRQVQDH